MVASKRSFATATLSGKPIPMMPKAEAATTARYIIRTREKFFRAREDLREIAFRGRNVVAPPTDASLLLQNRLLHVF